MDIDAEGAGFASSGLALPLAVAGIWESEGEAPAGVCVIIGFFFLVLELFSFCLVGVYKSVMVMEK